jgi:hypothetical protein
VDKLVPITSPIFTKPWLDPIKSPFTVSELIKAVAPCIFTVESDDTVRVAKVLPNCVDKYVVEIKFAKLAVEI